MIINANHCMKPLDIAAVRAFVVAAELRSFTRAGDVLGTTQSSISLKLSKLEGQLGRRLMERSPRHVRLSAEGLAFLDAARGLIEAHDRAAASFEVEERRLVVGVNHALIGSELPALLRRINAHDPSLRVEMRVGGTRELMALYDQGELDAAWVLRPDDHRKRSKAIYAEPFSWVATPGWQAAKGAPLLLATQGETCRIRNAATAVLDKAGIEWTEIFIGKGAATIGAAAAAGMAVAIMAIRTAPSGTVDVGEALGLPPVPAQEVLLYSSLNDRRSREALRLMSLAFQQMT
ncbi:LysR family transcriptional regulator [Stenotrophomonas terrae]|nr:LysR family transcriptional regulator [Stenotrophomonas terrae]